MANPKVFLSYCRDDQADVEKLRGELQAAGIDVWWDQDIRPGQDWKREVRRAMKESDRFLICFSKNSQARAKSGIFPELSDAIGIYRELAPGGEFIVPVRLSKCDVPDVELDATRTLDRIQCVDLFPPSKRAAVVKKLIEAVTNP